MNLFNFFADPLDITRAKSPNQALMLLIKNMRKQGFQFKPIVFLNQKGDTSISCALFVNLKKHCIKNIKIHYNIITKLYEAVEIDIPNQELKDYQKLKLSNQSNVIFAY